MLIGIGDATCPIGCSPSPLEFTAFRVPSGGEYPQGGACAISIARSLSPLDCTAFRSLSEVCYPQSRRCNPTHSPVLTCEMHSVTSRFRAGYPHRRRDGMHLIGYALSPWKFTAFRVVRAVGYPHPGFRDPPHRVILTDDLHSLSSRFAVVISTTGCAKRPSFVIGEAARGNRPMAGKPCPVVLGGTLTIQMHSVSSRLGVGYPHPSGSAASNRLAPSRCVIRQSTG